MNARDFALGVLSSFTAGIILFKLFRVAEAKEEEKEIKIPIVEGKIIALETKVYGKCEVNECIIGEKVTVFSTFKNIGNFVKRNIIGISVNDELVKSEFVELQPYQEYTMTYEVPIGDKTYDICGVVIE